MSDKARIGIIGTGVGLRTVAEGFVFNGGADIVALAGSSADRAKELGAKYDCEIYTGDYRDVLNADVDLICVTTPNEFHLEHMIAALETDKNVYLEKPTGNTAEEAQKIADHVSSKKRFDVVGHQMRFNPYVVGLRDEIAKGTIGRPYSIDVFYSHPMFIDKNMSWIWSHDTERGGGMRLALDVHLVDTVRFILGEEPVAIAATMDPVLRTRTPDGGESRESNASSYISIMMNFENCNADLRATASSQMTPGFVITVRGEEGDMSFIDAEALQLFRVGQDPKLVMSKEVNEEYDRRRGSSIFRTSFPYFADAMIDAIQSGATEIADACTVQEEVQNVSILDAVKRSANNGTRELLAPWPEHNKKYS
jgi:predicted dehydrogenase